MAAVWGPAQRFPAFLELCSSLVLSHGVNSRGDRGATGRKAHVYTLIFLRRKMTAKRDRAGWTCCQCWLLTISIQASFSTAVFFRAAPITCLLICTVEAFSETISRNRTINPPLWSCLSNWLNTQAARGKEWVTLQMLKDLYPYKTSTSWVKGSCGHGLLHQLRKQQSTAISPWYCISFIFMLGRTWASTQRQIPTTELAGFFPGCRCWPMQRRCRAQRSFANDAYLDATIHWKVNQRKSS